MAERLAKIFGTEEDKVNCPFYFKIGACRHGETCTRIHNKPPVSQTMVLPHLYDNPPAAVAFADGLNVPQENLVEAVNHFEDFYEEVFMELAKYGELEEVVVADNIGEHMIGNVYVKYVTEDQAQGAMGGLNGRYYAGKVIIAEYSPVTDFREAKCRQYNEGACDRGGYCNFMHPKHVSRDLKRQLFKQMYDDHPDYREDRKNRTKNGEVYKGDDRSQSHSRSKHDRSRKQRTPSGERRPQKPYQRHSRSRDRHHRSRHDSRERGGDHRDHRGGGDRGDRGVDYRGGDHRGGDHRDHHHREHREYRDHRAGDRDRGGRDDRRGRDDRDQRYDNRRDRYGDERPRQEARPDDSKLGRQTSEERRAMIAQWNAEEDQVKRN